MSSCLFLPNRVVILRWLPGLPTMPNNMLKSTLNRLTDPTATPQMARTLLYFFTAIAFAYMHAFHKFEWYLGSLSKLISFHAQNPYQTRILMPLIGNGLAQLLPIANITLFTFLEVISVFCLLLVFREFLVTIQLVDEKHENFGDLLALLILVPLVYNYTVLQNLYYPYDMPEMALFTLGLILILRQEWVLFYITFVIAVLTRETSGLLILALVLALYDKLPLRKLGLHVVVLVAIWGLIRNVVARIFQFNGGGLYEVHFMENLRYLYGALDFEPAAISTLMVFGGFLPFVLLSWRQQPSLLKRWLLMGIPFFAFILYTAVIREVRVFTEMVPIVTACAMVPFLMPFKINVVEPVVTRFSISSRQIVTALGVAAAVGLCLVVLSFWLVGRNLVANSSFEANLAGWTNANIESLNRSFDEGYHGGYSGHIVTSAEQHVQSDVMSVSAGSRYRMEAFVKLTNGAARVRLLTPDNRVLAENKTDGHNVWLRLTASATIPPDVHEVLISVDGNEQPSDFYLDLVELYQN